MRICDPANPDYDAEIHPFAVRIADTRWYSCPCCLNAIYASIGTGNTEMGVTNIWGRQGRMNMQDDHDNYFGTKFK